MSNPSETVTTTKSEDVVTTNTKAGEAEVVTKSTTEGTEVVTTVRSGQTADSAEFDSYIAIWAKAVDTQMHFNEMSVKSRQLGLTFVVAALGLAVVLASQKKDYSFEVLGRFHLHVAVLLISASAGAIWLVRMLDLGVYHRMLRGAVAFGEEFEERLLKPRLGVQKGMTQAISFLSRNPNGKFKLDEEIKYLSGDKSSLAGSRIQHFYISTIGVLVLLAAVVFAVTCSGPEIEVAPKGGGAVGAFSCTPIAP